MSDGPRNSNGDTALTGYTPPAPQEDLAPGTEVESFRIECTLGRGGMSTVYGAVHTVIGKRGAVKVLRRELCTDQKEVGRFVQEARAVNQIGHVNIVDVFAFGTLPDGRSYLIMEWLVGQSLRARIRRGPMTRSEVRDIVLDIVRALEATHAKQIIHRDLKPDNVFLVETPGERTRAKLLDFGVAKLTGEGRHDRTRIGAMLGTPQYLAPEQARGEADHRSDIYALGVMLFELAAGRPPFIGENALDVVSQHMTEPPPKLSTAAKGVTPELDALVDAMLAKEPADRPTLLRIRSEIETLGGPRTRAPSLQTGKRTQTIPPSPRRLGFVIAGLIGALAVVILIFVIRATGSNGETKQERQEKQREETREAREEKRQEPRPPLVEEPKPPPVQESKPPPPVEPNQPPTETQPEVKPPAPVVMKGTLVIDWKGGRLVTFSVDGAPVAANQPISLDPGRHTVVTRRPRLSETHTVDIAAGMTRTLSIPLRPGAPSRGPRDLNPENNEPR